MTRNGLTAIATSLGRAAWAASALFLVMIASGDTTLAAGPSVPGIDPGSSGAALTLLTGGVLILRDRVRRK